MTVRKIFWDDPYMTILSGMVTGVEGDVITLDRTIFYAYSGGQESDSGTIAGFRVLGAEKAGREIYYTLEGPYGLREGQVVEISIDWERRYALMRHHFAAEIILELVYQGYGEVNKIGAHISKERARLDFEWEGRISDAFPELLARAGDLVSRDLAIVSAFRDEETEQRYWEIEGFARVPCGGTHIRSTAEVGVIFLKRKNIGKGKERIEVTLQDPAERP